VRRKDFAQSTNADYPKINPPNKQTEANFMPNKYKEYKHLNLPAMEQEMLKQWKSEMAFEKSVELRNGAKPFVFYEGPPSANGMPGIHHVISRTLKAFR
jgi:isoleucyl-tRNA synthetase